MQPSEFRLLSSLGSYHTFHTELAGAIGLDECIIIQQVHRWCLNNETQEKNKKQKIHYKEGEWWCYNTLIEWQNTFPWWALRTMERKLPALVKQNYLVTGNYNKTSNDRTLWYRCNYDGIEDILLASREIKSYNVVSEGKPPMGNIMYHNSKGFIYLIQSDSYYKIGKTINLDTRLKSYYKTENPHEVRLILAVEVNSMSLAEIELHKFFSKKLYRGEWFLLEKKDIKKIETYLKQHAYGEY